MVVAQYSCQFPAFGCFFPYMRELKRTAILFAVFSVAKPVSSHLNSSRTFNGINLQTARY